MFQCARGGGQLEAGMCWSSQTMSDCITATGASPCEQGAVCEWG